MADAEKADFQDDFVTEEKDVENVISPEKSGPGDKEANKAPSPKPDQDPPPKEESQTVENSKEVAPPLITVTKGNFCGLG